MFKLFEKDVPYLVHNFEGYHCCTCNGPIPQYLDKEMRIYENSYNSDYGGLSLEEFVYRLLDPSLAEYYEDTNEQTTRKVGHTVEANLHNVSSSGQVLGGIDERWQASVDAERINQHPDLQNAVRHRQR